MSLDIIGKSASEEHTEPIVSTVEQLENENFHTIVELSIGILWAGKVLRECFIVHNRHRSTDVKIRRGS